MTTEKLYKISNYVAASSVVIIIAFALVAMLFAPPELMEKAQRMAEIAVIVFVPMSIVVGVVGFVAARIREWNAELEALRYLVPFIERLQDEQATEDVDNFPHRSNDNGREQTKRLQR